MVEMNCGQNCTSYLLQAMHTYLLKRQYSVMGFYTQVYNSTNNTDAQGEVQSEGRGLLGLGHEVDSRVNLAASASFNVAI